MSRILKIFKISRFRFWSYTTGPFLLGFILGTNNIYSIFSWQFSLTALFFLLPANIFLYGVNDLYDEDTDKYNYKKQEKEIRLKNSDKKFLKLMLVVSTGSGLLLLTFTQNYTAKFVLIFFWLLSFFYSVKPLRFKAIPFIDSLSNGLYILPGIYGFILSSNSLPPVLPVLGFWAWTCAMHLFSAIPDILPDKKAELKTTAVLLGESGSLILCSILWLIFFSITFYYFIYLPLIIFIIYPLMPLLFLTVRKFPLEKAYWFFPYINTLLGFLAFLLIVVNKK